MKAILHTFALLTVAPLLGFLLYVGLAWSPVLGGVDILFYRGLLLCGLSAGLLGLVLILARRRLPGLELIEIVAAVAVSLSVNLMFLIVLPVTIDRSISVFLLAEIDAHQSAPLTRPQLEQAFVQHYVRDMRQIDRRVREQTISGTITVEDGHIRLTPRGERFLALSRFLSGPFRTDPRFVGLAPARPATVGVVK